MVFTNRSLRNKIIDMLTVISNFKFNKKFSNIYSIPNTHFIFCNNLGNMISIINSKSIDLVFLLNINPYLILNKINTKIIIIHNFPNLCIHDKKSNLIYLDYNELSIDVLLLYINNILLKNFSKNQSLSNTGIIGKSKQIQTLKEKIITVAKYTTPVLIIGQTGTGKNLVAQSIHKKSIRLGKFITINCANLSDTLFESELFGHTKGSFTNADNKQGYLKLADKGTLFFDEFSELSLSNQPRLLRIIENQSFYRLGDVRETKTNTRLLFASNQSDDYFYSSKRFRRDLFYRVSTTIIRVPPLIEHIEDISDLVTYYALKKRYQYNISELNIQYLKEYTWPGNVRELFSFLDRINIFYSNKTLIDFPREKLYKILLQKD